MTRTPQDAPTALFVRIPHAQARALDRIAFESRRPKQAVVSELLARYIDAPAARRPRIAALEGESQLGHYAFRETERDVLTLDGVAELLDVDASTVDELARAGELPGRLIGGEWRFARSAVLAWLAAGSVPDASDG